MTRTVVISGGSRGLGEAIGNAFYKDGDNVATFSRSMLPNASGPRWMAETVDMADTEVLAAFVERVRNHFGSIDVLVNNAGLADADLLAMQSDDAIERMLDVNLHGTIALTKACLRAMLARQNRLESGRVVTITSVVAETGVRGLSVYSATKAALHGFTRSLAREYGERNITVNAVAPGFIETEMTHELTAGQRAQIIRRTPAGRLGCVEDVVPLVQFLCSDAAAFINGQIITVDGGASA